VHITCVVLSSPSYRIEKVDSFCFSPNSRFLILGTETGNVVIIDYSDEKAQVMRIMQVIVLGARDIIYA
jgi:hypothetical protein